MKFAQKNLIIIFFLIIFFSRGLAQSLDSVVTVLFTGDVTMANHFEYYVRKNYAYPFARAQWLKDADVSVINLEGPLTNATKAAEKPFVFKAPMDYTKILKLGGIDLANLANNHIYDYGKAGLLQTIAALEKAGIRHVGAGRNLIEARKPVIFKVKGIKLGFLAYYGVRPHAESHPATENDAGTALRNLRFIRQDVHCLRPKVDFLTVIFHWGFENEHFPKKYQIKFAHRVIEYGADLIVGHHPHVLQGVEKFKHGIIAYSLGNFIFGGNSKTYYQSAVLKVTIPVHRPKNWETNFLPIEVDHWQPRLLKSADADSVLRHIAEYSKIFAHSIQIKK